ncbi:MAG: hypothetical protein HY457_02735 [Parcubacteria group bacterium]|nr:hypothetical protein [Parcubacteria group bacterium]
MHIVGEWWFVWIIGWALCLAYIINNQLRRIGGMAGGMLQGNVGHSVNSFKKGLFGMMYAGVAGTIFFALFVVAVLYNIFAG